MKKKTIYVIIILTSFIIGFLSGFSAGVYQTLSWTFDRAVYFLELKGVEIDIDKQMVIEGVQRYKNNIGGCWDIEHAPLFNYTWYQKSR